MAVLGFLVLVLLAIAVGVVGITVLVGARAFGSVHRADYAYGLVLLAISAGLTYVAYENSPFSIALKVSAA